MICCQHCQTTNSLDSAFCKRCGTALSPDDLREARSLLGRAVGQGFVKFNEGNIVEAAAIAEHALVSDPELPEAISLKAMCHEYNMQFAEALECYRRVLDINPNSSLDRIKVDQMQNMLSMGAAEIPGALPNRRVALIRATAAAVFVLAIGSLAATMMSHRRDDGPAPDVAVSKPVEQFATNFPDTPTTAAQSTAAPSKASDETPVANSVAAVPAQERASPAAVQNVPSSGSRALPAIDPSTANTPVDPQPFKIEIVPDKVVPDKQPPKNVDPDPKPAETLASTSAQPQTFDSSVIEIKVSNPKHVTGGAQEVADTNNLQVLAHTASAQFQLRHYDSAAKAYERLLRSGGDASTVNQRLGQCYENLGRRSDALGAYQKAITALESNISSGKGNATRARSALDACKQAVKVLQGS